MKRELHEGLLPPGVDIYLVEEQANPSTDYFVLPACAGQGRRLHRFRFDDPPPAGGLAGAVVIFVRYVPALWRRQVQAERAQLAGLVYFMDDDVLDSQAWAGMPWRYRYKLHRLGARHRGWLRKEAQLWVSTEWLEHKYAAWEPRRVDPRPLRGAANACRVFYHGSASHAAEIRWLRPVMEQVLLRSPRISFEIIGGQDVNKLYRDLPRVTVVHPMKWPAYEAFLDQPGRHIGLAPLLALPFNQARSCTKFFDITRAGAPGIYAAGGACGKLVRNGVDGFVLPMEPAAWVTAILQLAADEELRLAMAASARETIASDLAALGFSGPSTG
jgi:hypothetical protein